MKKFLICILCLVSIKSFSQFRLGVQGSLSALNFWQTDVYTGDDPLEFTWAMNGFQAGLFGEYDLGYSGFEIQPALMYVESGSHLGQSKGFAPDGNFVIGYQDTHLRIYSLRLPVNVLYSYRVNTKWKVFGGLGPYISKNLSGTEKGWYRGYDNSTNNYTSGGGPINNNITLSGNSSYAAVYGQSNVASIDAGMDILLGFQYKKVQFSMSWMRGFTKQYHTSKVNLGNEIWNFTLGYVLFGHERKPKL